MKIGASRGFNANRCPNSFCTSLFTLYIFGGWLGRFMVFKDWGLMLLNIEMKCVIPLALYQKV